MRTPITALSFLALGSLLLACAAPAKSGAPPSMPGGFQGESRAVSDSAEAAPASAAAAPMTSQPFVGAPAQAPAVPSQPAQAAKTAATGKPAQAEVVSDPDVFILYTGELALLVDDGKMAPTADKVIDAAIAVGGHIGSRKDASVSVVVPSKSFRAVFAQLEGLGEVTHRSIAAEDVSAEYHDAEVRLQNLKATRKRLEEFLAKAPSVNDMLTVERELERVVMDIDRTEGRLRFLREHTAFSTLTVTLSAKPKSAAIIAHDPPPPPPPAPPRAIDLPAPWLGELGVQRLFNGK